MKQPSAKRLSQGQNSTVLALSEAEVGKIFRKNAHSTIRLEADKLRFANQVNGLMPRFLRLDFDAESQSEMLVMERLMPLDYRAFQVEKRRGMFEVFEQKLKELHETGFVHLGLESPTHSGGELYDNILLTAQGIRLIGAGRGILKREVGEKLFSQLVRTELQELWEFKDYFLGR